MHQVTHETTVDAQDGADLFIHGWPKENSKAVILGVHGLGEHSGSYWMLAKGLESQPIELVVSDLRGHGRSSGKRGVGTIDDYVSDLGVILKTVRNQVGAKSIFLLGHSMGGLILSKYLVSNPTPQGVKGAIFSSPFLGLSLTVPGYKKMSAKLLARFAPSFTLFNEINYGDLSHDPECIAFHEHDTWRHDRISANLYLSMMDSIDYVFLRAPQLKLPVLFQLAGSDRVVSTPASQKFFEQVGSSDKTIHTYPNQFHEIYNEKERAIPIGHLAEWVLKHI